MIAQENDGMENDSPAKRRKITGPENDYPGKGYSGPVEELTDPRETVQEWSKTTDFSGPVEEPADPGDSPGVE